MIYTTIDPNDTKPFGPGHVKAHLKAAEALLEAAGEVLAEKDGPVTVEQATALAQAHGTVALAWATLDE